MDAVNSPFLAVCRGQIPTRTPVWILRQAGRYLPEYRALRGQFKSFLDFLDHPAAAAEATCQPPDLIGVDAAILFSDILVVLPPMGLDLTFAEGEGPRVSNPLREESRIRSLKAFDPAETLGFVLEAARLSRQNLPPHIPLIGFAGAPWTVACYAIEGRGGNEFPSARAMAQAQPKLLAELLEYLTDRTVDYLCAQAQAGVQVLQIFESWISLLSVRDYASLVGPSLKRLVSETKRRTGLPVILYANGAGPHLATLEATEADVLGIDWRCHLSDARKVVGQKPLQGNFDPTLLLAPPEIIAAKVQETSASFGGPWIANLGHGILPHIPVEGARALVQAVHALPVRVA